ncbi:uncharacterized protein Hap1MRO34_009898 isoform 1-T3 [Clarias gariepinus]
MSDSLVVTFQSQLSLVMETILKSAMMEITRLVEDSFMEEVARGKQEVELLLHRLQFSESKLKEREKRVRCPDCGRSSAGGERTPEKPTETLAGEDALCFRLSLREQSEKRPQFGEDWSSTESLGSYRTTETHSDKEKNINSLDKRGKQESVSNTEVQHVQCISAPVTRTHEACSNSKPRESHCKTPVTDFTPSKDIDLDQSRPIQSATEEDEVMESAQSPSYTAVKSELHPDPVDIKEEEEMLPVWDCGDDCAPAETDQNLSGSWNRDETQVDNFPNVTALNMPDPSSHVMSYSVNCNSEVLQGIKAEPSEAIPTELVHLPLAPVPEGSSSFDPNENRHLFGPESLLSHPELCLGEKLFLPFPQTEHLPVPTEKPHYGKLFVPAAQLKVHMLTHQASKPLKCPQCAKTFAHDFELKDHQKQHSKERPHICPDCGKGFTRFSNYKQHQNIHTHEKLFNCTHCGMRFKRSTHLRIHLRRHSRVGKSCPCRQCGKTFLCLKQLKSHLLKVHGTEMN